MSTTTERARDLLEAYAPILEAYNVAKADKADLLARAGRSLLEAVKAGDIGECRELLAIEGVDIHIKGSEGPPNWGRTPVMWACDEGYLDILEYLVSKGAIINDKTSDGNNCLMWACLGGNLNIVEYLVSKGMNINDSESGGYSCLMLACLNSCIEIVEYLMSKGAGIHAISNNRATCFSLALRHSKIKVLYRLRKWPTTIAIIMLQELALIYIIDSESLIDLHQYLGRPDDLKTDNEEDYKKDEEGNVLDPDVEEEEEEKEEEEEEF
jgi:hypothetical protein